ncbi:MAG: hypothetical protein CMJ58_19455 [Planctomycetaceae bacterium]|nr:hypothetical protein [Planctomycetaceae bacterium]
MRVFVTGASGFVGGFLTRRLLRAGRQVCAGSRRPQIDQDGVAWVRTGDLGAETDLTPWLQGIDCVVHLASHDHFVGRTASSDGDRFHAVNALGTQRVAQQARDAGVPRMVYVSSIKAVGEGGDAPYHESTPCQPETAYGRSKFEGERRLFDVASHSDLECVVLRPPIVYGPGVGKSFLRMLDAVRKGLPLPLGLLGAKRSLISVHNLVDAIVTSVESPAAAGKTYHVADACDLTTPELIRLMARLMGRPCRLAPAPPLALRLAGALTGKRAEVDRLLRGLTISRERIESELGWAPPVATEQALQETIDWRLGQFRRAA